MDEQDPTPPQAEQNPPGLSWLHWPGVSVYGLHKGAPPPDYLAPMQQQPARLETPAPAAPEPAVSHHAQEQPAPPPPAPEQPSFPMPSPLGPAMTPDDRARELGFIPPDPPQHP